MNASWGRRLSWADRIVYALIFAALAWIAFEVRS